MTNYRVPISGKRYRKFETVEAAREYCHRMFEKTGVVLTIIQQAPAPVPTADQMAALRDYAAKHGREWKSALWFDWQAGCVNPLLQQVRNTFGPSWLQTFKLEN